MKPIKATFVILFLLTSLATPNSSRADEWYVGGTIDLSLDSDNPLTNALIYTPVSLDVTYLPLPYLGLHASTGIGGIFGSRTDGSVIKIATGPVLQYGAGQVTIGTVLDLGFERISYTESNDRSNYQNALVLEPRLFVAVSLGQSNQWLLSLEAGPRWKWLANATDDDMMSGWGLGLSLGHRF